MIAKETVVDSKKISKEHQILQLKMTINKKLYEEQIISYQVLRQMQSLLLKRMNKK